MPSLADITRETVTVTVRGIAFELGGIEISDLARMLGGSDVMKKLFTGDAKNIGAADIMKLPDMVGPIIAAGIGRPGDPKEIKGAKNLNAEDQLKMITAIWKLTMPNGIVPFMEALSALVAEGSAPDSGAAGREPDSN